MQSYRTHPEDVAGSSASDRMPPLPALVAQTSSPDTVNRITTPLPAVRRKADWLHATDRGPGHRTGGGVRQLDIAAARMVIETGVGGPPLAFSENV